MWPEAVLLLFFITELFLTHCRMRVGLQISVLNPNSLTPKPNKSVPQRLQPDAYLRLRASWFIFSYSVICLREDWGKASWQRLHQTVCKCRRRWHGAWLRPCRRVLTAKRSWTAARRGRNDNRSKAEDAGEIARVGLLICARVKGPPGVRSHTSVYTETKIICNIFCANPQRSSI